MLENDSPSGTQACRHTVASGHREVLNLICAVHIIAEIAGELFLAAEIVDHHVSAVPAKLGTTTREAATAHAARLWMADTAEI